MDKIMPQYTALEEKVIDRLKEAINKSKYESKHVSQKAIKVNIFDYKELTIINDDLIFLDKHGYHFSLFADCSIVDLIEIADKL